MAERLIKPRKVQKSRSRIVRPRNPLKHRLHVRLRMTIRYARILIKLFPKMPRPLLHSIDKVLQLSNKNPHELNPQEVRKQLAALHSLLAKHFKGAKHSKISLKALMLVFQNVKEGIILVDVKPGVKPPAHRSRSLPHRSHEPIPNQTVKNEAVKSKSAVSTKHEVKIKTRIPVRALQRFVEKSIAQFNARGREIEGRHSEQRHLENRLVKEILRRVRLETSNRITRVIARTLLARIVERVVRSIVEKKGEARDLVKQAFETAEREYNALFAKDSEQLAVKVKNEDIKNIKSKRVFNFEINGEISKNGLYEIVKKALKLDPVKMTQQFTREAIREIKANPESAPRVMNFVAEAVSHSFETTAPPPPPAAEVAQAAPKAAKMVLGTVISALTNESATAASAHVAVPSRLDVARVILQGYEKMAHEILHSALDTARSPQARENVKTLIREFTTKQGKTEAIKARPVKVPNDYVSRMKYIARSLKEAKPAEARNNEVKDLDAEFETMFIGEEAANPQAGLGAASAAPAPAAANSFPVNYTAPPKTAYVSSMEQIVAHLESRLKTVMSQVNPGTNSAWGKEASAINSYLEHTYLKLMNLVQKSQYAEAIDILKGVIKKLEANREALNGKEKSLIPLFTMVADLSAHKESVERLRRLLPNVRAKEEAPREEEELLAVAEM